MSYDVFSEFIYPKMKELFSKDDENIEDEFIFILKESGAHSDKFKRRLLTEVLLEGDDVDEIDSVLLNLFNLLNGFGNRELKKIEYYNDANKIIIKYYDKKDEEE